jgi:hypothetical protein
MKMVKRASHLGTIAVAALLCLGLTANAKSASLEGHDAFAGIWMIERPMHAVKTADGRGPPLLPQAQEVYRSNVAAARNGDKSFDSTSWCAGAGVPRLMFAPYPFELVVQPRRIAFLYQWNHWARVIDMVSKKLEVIYGISMGYPVGHWDGETLVIETRGLREDTLLDSAGLPHSAELKLTERLTLLRPDRLEDRIMIDDPMTFSHPWETVVTFRRQPEGTVIKEDVCLDRIREGEAGLR